MSTGEAPVDLGPTHNDLANADLMMRAVADVQAPGRFGDRKVFISEAWARMQEMDTQGLTAGATLDDFKNWLLRNLRQTRDGRPGGVPLVVMARADFVSAMDPRLVAASQLDADGATYNFILDPAVEVAAYRPYTPKASRFPRRNPGGLTENPVWATKVIADAWEVLEGTIPVAWFPKLEGIRAEGDGVVSAEVLEYGCGVYGCAFPTSDANVVMKITTDDTEAEFAAGLANQLVRPICVTYYKVMGLPAKHKDRPVFLLWRESAERVGQIRAVLGDAADDLVFAQFEAAKKAYLAIMGRASRRSKRTSDTSTAAAIRAWLLACEAMARQTKVPELRELGDGLVEIYAQQRIVFGDIHSGNLGAVKRAGRYHWVITDPGNIAVLDDAV